MDTHYLWFIGLSTIGLALTSISLLVSLFWTRQKIRARKRLLEKLVQDRDFICSAQELHNALLQRFAEADSKRAGIARLEVKMHHGTPTLRIVVERAREDVLKHVEELDASERKLVEAGIYQSSPVGRRRYVEKLAEDALELAEVDREAVTN